MILRWFVMAALAVSASIAGGELAAQVTTRIPTELPTEISPKLPAEQPRRTTASKVLVEGCIARAKRDGPLGTGLGSTSSPNTADRDANSSETLDVFMLTNALQLPRDPGVGMDGTSFALEGREQEVELHAGHRVQISGALAPPRSSITSRSSAATGVQRLVVDTVTMLSASCVGPALR